MNKMDEMIMVVDKDKLFDDGELIFQGIQTSKPIVNRLITNCGSYFETRRGSAETNTRWKQPIPYVVLTRGDEVFIYERLKGGGEYRLHNKLSIGVGGHMNRVNDIQNFKDNLYLNLFRELDEEVFLDTGGKEANVEIIGIINDDTEEVSKVHVGILVEVKLDPDASVEVRETDVLDGYWIRRKDLVKHTLFDRLESWSQIAAAWMV